MRSAVSTIACDCLRPSKIRIWSTTRAGDSHARPVVREPLQSLPHWSLETATLFEIKLLIIVETKMHCQVTFSSQLPMTVGWTVVSEQVCFIRGWTKSNEFFKVWHHARVWANDLLMTRTMPDLETKVGKLSYLKLHQPDFLPHTTTFHSISYPDPHPPHTANVISALTYCSTVPVHGGVHERRGVVLIPRIAGAAVLEQHL